ncbi:hypothetical protein AMS68_000612 [Peltaster fructicola]|uniref:Peptidyl-prolyl cis-trans isomerase-like 2 n=1 Tax=Peltaster fructicola TaxID=286661 RepID=A0A6H0XKE3_9PEZI|nr:hypothetical protein AMS68_000612 [Peltaster fructicola]
MGRGTDKLSLTVDGANFKKLPFNYCALSLQPFEHPVCTSDGNVFDLTNIIPWLNKHHTNPVNGEPLSSKDLIKLNFAKNDEGAYADPVTYKVLTENTHIVALRPTGNVFSWETVERLNIKAKNWKDLVTDEAFERKDIITIQDPQNVAARDMSAFKYLQDGVSALTPEQESARSVGVNEQNIGSAAKILKAKEAVARKREERAKAESSNGEQQALVNARKAQGDVAKSSRLAKAVPYNAAGHTTGAAAASFTSTGLTPSTSTDRAILSDEEYMLHPRRVKQKGYARLSTTQGEVTIELYPEWAPKTVWNFVQLAKRGYYKGVDFHRNIKGFMLQGGDPTGTGRGGQSCWGKTFSDEFAPNLHHDSRGVVSMANKGKDTNTSQFFITYRAVPHLDRKHTIFGKVVDGLDALNRLESVDTDEKDRPTEGCRIEDLVIYVDPFEEFLKQREEQDAQVARKEAIRLQGGSADDRTTWTGKKLQRDGKADNSNQEASIGKYLKSAATAKPVEDEIAGEWDELEPPTKKVKKGGGFGDFDSW